MPFSHPMIDALIEALRRTQGRPSEVEGVMAQATSDLLERPDQAAAMRAEVVRLLEDTDTTHLLTEAGLLADEPLLSGILHRLVWRIAPMPTQAGDREQALTRLITTQDQRWILSLTVVQIRVFIEALTAEAFAWSNPPEYASAIVILATRIAGAGVDPRLVDRMPDLESWNSPFLELARTSERFASSVVAGTAESDAREAFLGVIDRCEERVAAFRAEKTTVGTTLDLSSRSLRMLQQIRRMRMLVRLSQPEGRTRNLAQLLRALLRAGSSRLRILQFMREKLDLIAYLVVGNAAKKGEGYLAWTWPDMRSFLSKSLAGGLLVAGFASLKLYLSVDIPEIPQALLYGLNYALCFALIYLVGATLATKQPAMTASRIAESLKGAPGDQRFAHLVQALWRCQFVSFLGNVIGAAVVTLGIAFAFGLGTGEDFVTAKKAAKLAHALHPTHSASLYYAAIAGVLLALTGIVSGVVDNAVVFHRLGHRIRQGTGIFGWLPARAWLAKKVEYKLGGVTGNILLGFLMGSAGTLGHLTGLPIDIRHIAFASSHATLAVVFDAHQRTPLAVASLFSGVLLIGLVNFLVSFAVTLTIAVQARRIETRGWRMSLKDLRASFIRQPIRFFLPGPADVEGEPQDSVPSA